MDLAERLDRYIASKSRKPDPFASDTDAMRDQLTSGGMSEDQAFDLALAMARERERARDVPEENILGGDMSRLFQQDPTMMERIKRLPAQTLGAGEALASLGSAAALSVPSMVQSLVTGEKDPLGMMKRQMYVPKTEEGMGALTAVGELLPEIPAMPQVQLQALQAIPAGAAAAQAQRGVKQSAKQLAPKAGEMLDEYMKRTGMRLDLTAYHGSPYQFEEFDPTKIGTGEGAQAYGYGFYFAENPKVAGTYKDPVHALPVSPLAQQAYAVLNSNVHPSAKAKALANLPKEAIEEAKAFKGNLYTVDIPDEMIGKMLDWDKPISQQPKSIQKAINDIVEAEELYKGKFAARFLDKNATGGDILEVFNEALGSPQVTSSYLRDAGIPGVRYYDQASRPTDITSRKLIGLYDKYGDVDKAVDEMMRTVHNTPKEKQRIRKQFVDKLQSGLTRNFVVFPGEEKAIKMLERKRDGGSVQSFQTGGIVKGAVAGAKAGAKGAKAAKAAKSEDEKTLPMILERAPAKTKKELQEEAERIGRQIIGEHVTKPGDTANLAGYSKKVAERLKAMEEGRDYVLEQTAPVSPLASMDPAKGSILIGLPGDISIADKELKSLGNLEIGSQQQGGSLYGLPFKDDPEEIAKFWASNYGPANIFQKKVSALGGMYPDQDILGAYMSMGRTGMNFAQHFADANLKAIRSAIRAGNVSQDDIESFNKMIREGWSKKNKKTGEREYFKYPDFAGIENTGEAYAQMMRDPELRKWFNDRMKIGEETAPRGLPSGVDIEWAISEPALRNLEHSLVGYSVGKMQPGKELIAPVEHATYSHGIPGRAVGRLPGHVTARIAFPDASKVIAETKRPQDFTGTIQKVFPHQVVDQQWQDEVGQYLQYLKRITGKKKGGLVQVFQSGGKVISLAAKAAKAAKEAKVAKPVAKEAVPVLSTVDFADKNWRSAIDDVVKYMNNVGVPYAPWQFMRDKPDVPLGRIMDEIERDVYFVRSNPILPEGQVNLLEELFKKAREAEASYTRSGTPRDPMTGEPTMASGGLSFLAGGGKVVKAAAKAAKAAGTVVPKVIEPVRTTDIPEKEGVLRLFHGGSDPGFEAVPRGGRFDGFFALPDEVGGHGTGHNYFADIPQERILTNYDLNYELPLNKVVEAFEKTTGIKQGDSRFDPAWRAIVEETNANEMALAAKLADDYGDAGWEAQRMRGQLAKQLGYDAIEMQDEHGRSYLITSGVPLKYIGSKNK